MMDSSFDVVVVSNENVDYFPHNSNSKFSNLFPTSISLSDYEVALSSIAYYDNYVKVDPSPIPEPEVPTDDFFDMEKRDNEVLVEKTQKNTLNLLKENPDLPSLITYVATECNKHGINIAIDSQFANNKIVKTRLSVTVRTGWKIEITDPLLSILGFEQTDFENGQYLSTTTVDYSQFESLKMQAPIGSVVLFKRETSGYFLPQIKGTPTFAGLLSQITLLLGNAGYNVSLVLKKKARTIEFKGLSLIRMSLSRMVNDFLGIPERFVFTDQGSIRIADSIIYPDKSIIPVKEKISWSKLLVLCDIVYEQIVAGSTQKLLAVLVREESREFKRHFYSPSKLTYKPVSRAFVNQISLSLKTDNNKFLDFSEQPTTVVLHFRKRFIE